MSRQSIRTGIAAYFGGSTLDARGFYRPGPLAASGLSGVRAYYNERVEDRDYFDGLPAGSTWGAVMGVHLAASTETRLTIGGTLDRPYAVELYVWYLASRPTPEAAQATFDDLLEAIVNRIHEDPTLGMGPNSGAAAIVTQAGEGTRGVTVSSAVPYTEPATETRGSAVVSFDVSTYPNIP